ncbi:MAG: hypothetical protein WC980_06300 [Candidatus Brocadiia bacterium]
MNKSLCVFVLGMLILLVTSACEDARIPQLQQELKNVKEELSKTKEELKITHDEFQQTKANLENTAGELVKVNQQAQEKEKTARTEIEALKLELNKSFENMTRDGIVIPSYLVNKIATIYIKTPKGTAEEVGIVIGLIKEIIQKEKIVVSIKPDDHLLEIPYNNITGYRLTK